MQRHALQLYTRIFGLILIFTSLFGLVSFNRVYAGAPQNFDPNLLIDDASFTDVNSMSAADIQAFLERKGSYLATFSQDGRSAAQIIWDASHGYGDASGSINEIAITANTGTVNPRVILATLQKEQSLISNPNPSSGALNAAMGYGCPDGGGCNPSYRGFTKQVEWASWQLRYNYEASGKDDNWRNRYYPNTSFPYKPMFPGESVVVTNSSYPYNPPAEQNVAFGNKATASLYRYTPHVYNGNYHFWSLYRQWFSDWSAEFVSQSANPAIQIGGSAEFTAQFRNTGTQMWHKGTVRLGTDQARDRISPLLRENQSNSLPTGWVSDNRVEMLETSVSPGQIGTFRFYYTVPNGSTSGVTREPFNLVADGVEWISGATVAWDISVLPLDNRYRAQAISQNSYPTLVAGASYDFELVLRNTGTETWTSDIVRLGTSHFHDRTPSFTRGAGWISDNRVELVEDSVAPGNNGTFRFTYTVPNGAAAGTYREYFRPVADGLTWMDDWGIYWDVRVLTPTPGFHAEWHSQSAYPNVLITGESHEFEIQFRNIGTQTWQKSTVRLGTSHSENRVSQLSRGAGWISDNRVELVEESVSTGQIGTFRFVYSVPDSISSNIYREHFRPVVDGITWMEDYGVYWDIPTRTLADSYHAAWVNQNSYPTLSAGQSYQFELQLRNTGVSTWQRNTVRLGSDQPHDRTPIFTRGAGWITENRVELVEATVAPNAIGTFRFTYTVPNGAAAGTYREYFRPVADGIVWMDDWGIYWDVTVE